MKQTLLMLPLFVQQLGAEFSFECDTLEKFESFMLHLLPEVNELHVVFTGAELNVEGLPLDVLSRIRPCVKCRQACRACKFDFQSLSLYHEYCKGPAFKKPDLVCFFNPGLYRSTGVGDNDTWPETIRAAVRQCCPILVTSYTEFEAPMDLEKLIEIADNVKIVQLPSRNPFSSQKPERNFISEEIQPWIFKNYYFFVVK